MAKLADAIGPTFAMEMHAASLSHLPVAWSAEGEFFNLDMIKPWQQAELEKVIAAHDPTATLPPDPLSDHEVRITSLETTMAAMQARIIELEGKRSRKKE